MSQLRYQCSRCGFMMSEPRSVCPSCKANLFLETEPKPDPAKLAKLYAPETIKKEVIISCILMGLAVVGLVLYLLSKPAPDSGPGPMLLIGGTFLIGLTWLINVLDRKDKGRK